MNPQQAAKAYALELLATAVGECRKAGLRVVTTDDKNGLMIKVWGAYILKDGDDTFVLSEDSDEMSDMPR